MEVKVSCDESVQQINVPEFNDTGELSPSSCNTFIIYSYRIDSPSRYHVPSVNQLFPGSPHEHNWGVEQHNFQSKCKFKQLFYIYSFICLHKVAARWYLLFRRAVTAPTYFYLIASPTILICFLSQCPIKENCTNPKCIALLVLYGSLFLENGEIKNSVALYFPIESIFPYWYFLIFFSKEIFILVLICKQRFLSYHTKYS